MDVPSAADAPAAFRIPSPPARVVPPPTAIDTAREIIADSVLESLRRIGAQAYFEAMARTDPNLFYKYVALLMPRPESRGNDNRTLIQNIIPALPRSPLDGLPPDFDVHR
jgi:hypothetical protein